jgi:hypothetical protein
VVATLVFEAALIVTRDPSVPVAPIRVSTGFEAERAFP